MLNKCKKIISILLLGFLGFCVSAEMNPLMERAYQQMSTAVINGDYSAAYSRAKFIISQGENSGFPEEIVNDVIEAVIRYESNLENNGDYETLLKVENEISGAPAEVKSAANPAIQRAKNHFKKIEEEKLRQAEEERRRIEEAKVKEEAEARAKQQQEARKAEQDRIAAEERKLQIELEKAKMAHAAEEKRNSDQREWEEKLRKERQEESENTRQIQEEMRQKQEEMQLRQLEVIQKASENSNSTITTIMIVVVILFILVVGMVVYILIKQNKQHQMQMENTLKTMQSLRMAVPSYDALPFNMAVENQVLQIVQGQGGSTASPLQLGDSSLGQLPDGIKINNGEQNELYTLLKTCKRYGEQIDEVTGRKNVSNRVAELVYKISTHMGLSEEEAILNYAASLVYDIGFLDIDQNLLHADTLTEEQFEVIKTHAEIGPNMMFFVGPKYREIFKAAAGLHHENIDGSGYPNGLSEPDIPFIAKVLRVAESYIALISKRTYKDIKDRDEALAELKSMTGDYDQSIVEALDEIV